MKRRLDHDPHIQRAHDAALAIAGEAGHVSGLVLIAEIDGGGLIVAFDIERLGAERTRAHERRAVANLLRRAADKIERGEG